MKRVVVVAAAAVAAVACSPPDLGDSPFLCNNGTPQCPEGYRCVTVASGQQWCVKDGLPPPDLYAHAPDASVDAAPELDLGVLDVGLPPDRSVPDTMPLDTLPPPDTSPPDTLPPPDVGHFGCQSNADCVDLDYRCCCPIPFLPMIWECLPLCLDPFCI